MGRDIISKLTQKPSSSPTDKEWSLLLHLDTLTTAIEDVLTELKNPGDLLRDSHIQAILEEALNTVWQTGSTK